MLFSTYGPVLDIVTRRMNMRGQAHVVFRDIQTSTQAMRALQGFDFLGKEMKIVYGKGQSHIIGKLRGTFEMPAAAPAVSESTELQKSVFAAPPSGMPARPAEVNGVKPSSLPQRPPQGTKRRREEEEDQQEEKPGKLAIKKRQWRRMKRTMHQWKPRRTKTEGEHLTLAILNVNCRYNWQRPKIMQTYDRHAEIVWLYLRIVCLGDALSPNSSASVATTAS